MQSSKYTYYADEDFTFDVEVMGNVANLHCEVRNFKLSTLKNMYRELGSFLASAKEAGLIKVFAAPKHPRFAELLGGRFSSTLSYNNQLYKVYTWVIQ